MNMKTSASVARDWPTILYVVEWEAFSESGVLRKVVAQVNAWKGLGAKATLVLVSPDRGAQDSVVSGSNIVVITFREGRRGFSKISKVFALRRLKKTIESLQPEIVVYRQSSWTPGILSAICGSHLLVVEINSLESEMRSGAYSLAIQIYHWATRKIVTRRADAFLCVSEEIADENAWYRKPIHVTGNGYDCETIRPRAKRESTDVQLIFVGSPGYPWNGIDKVLSLARQCPQWTFHIVGEEAECDLSNVVLHGNLSLKKLLELYKLADIGISTLALHRKGMKEASPLKSREYLAAGLPVIGAYHDTDLSGCPFYLELKNEEACINEEIERIRRFVEFWKNKGIDHQWVRNNIDWRAKEGVRLSFIKNLEKSSGVE